MKKFFVFLIALSLLLSGCKQTENFDKQRSLTIDEETIELSAIQIPFGEFQLRWNAVSDEITFENYIQNVELREENGEKFILATIDYGAKIKVVNENDYVAKVEITTAKSDDENKKYAMLSSWMQLLMLTNPQIQMGEIDEIFRKLHIGANASIESLTAQSFTHGQVQYHVQIFEDVYVFAAIMPSAEVK